LCGVGNSDTPGIDVTASSNLSNSSLDVHLRVVAYTHAVETVRLRHELLLNHFAVMHLFYIYKLQGEVCVFQWLIVVFVFM
jgi:hypothetical protein